MKLNLKYLALLGLAVIFFNTVQAQVQFSLETSAKEIGRKDELRVSYVLSGTEDAQHFKPPYFQKWKVISGPDFSTETYIINGVKTNTTRYSYLLAPATTGTLRLPSASIQANKKKYSTGEVSILVRKQDHVAGLNNSATTPQFVPGYSFEERPEAPFEDYVLKPGEDPLKKIRNNLFVKAIASKEKVYVGEPVLVSYKLYTRLKSNSRVVKQPSFTGCSVTEMTTSDVQAEVETINGKKYKTYLFRKVQLFPLQPGLMMVGQASVDNSIEFITSSSDLKKLYYDNQAGEVHQLTLTTDPYSIEVMPLPGKEKSSAVGNFEVIAKLKHDTIAANQANALIVTVAGAGNFKTVSEPEISWPENLYHFDATETDELDRLSFPVSGKRVYEIPFEVGNAGVVKFPPVLFSYFDPNQARYRTVQSQPLQLTVTPAIRANLREAISREADDGNIHFLLYLLPLVFAAGAVVIWRKSKTRPQPAIVVPVTEEKQPEMVFTATEDRLNELLLVQDDAIFYSEARELARDLLREGKGDADKLLQVIEECNTVLYTPIPSTSRKEVFEKLQQAV